MGLHGDDPPVLCPYLLEQREQELAPLGRLGLDVPEAEEVIQQRAGAVNGWVGWGAEALYLFLDRLAAHDVLRLGEVAPPRRSCGHPSEMRRAVTSARRPTRLGYPCISAQVAQERDESIELACW